MKFQAPQIIYFCLISFGLGVALYKWTKHEVHGGKLILDIIMTALFMGLLYWGGFFG